MRWLVLGLLATLALAWSACSSSDNADSGTGNTGCTKSTDCQTGFACIAGACGLPGSVQSGGVCWASRDCAGASFCSAQSSRCTASGSGLAGAGCQTDGDCAQGLRCDYSGLTTLCVLAGSGDLTASCTSSADCIAGLFCNTSNTCVRFGDAFTPFGGVTCQPDTGPFHSFFVVPRGGAALPDFFRLPYPNDVRVSGGATKTLNLTGFPTPGTTVLGVDIVKIYLDALTADFDGFSTLPVIDFRFNVDVDAGTQGPLSNGAIHAVDLATGDESGYLYNYDTSQSKYYCPFFLTVAPNATYKFNHTYAVWLDDRIRTTTGGTPTQDPDLAAVLAATRPTDADLGHAWDQFAPFRSYMGAKGIAASSVMNAAVFTTADPTVHMAHVAAAVAAEPAPTLSALFECGVTAGTDACDDGTAARKCGSASNDFFEIHGKINLPIYQNGTEPYETTANGGKLNESGGTVTKVRSEDVCFALTIPKTAAPGGGWPLVVYGHGTGGSFREFIADNIAGELAQKGVAAVGIDEVGHGARRGSSKIGASNLVFNVTNPPAARDNWLQMGADVLSVVKLPHSATPQGWTGPALSFNAGKIVYFGHSQGATAGELAIPFTEDVHAVVMSGAGALLRESLNAKTSPSNILNTIEYVLGEEVLETHPIYLIWQNYFDRIDPFNTNRLMVQEPPSGKTAKHVFMTMGAGDTFAPPTTLSLNATTLGLGKTDPVLIDFSGPSVSRPVSKNVNNVTAAAFQYTPSGYDGHFVAQQNASAIADWTAFITSYFSTGTPTVP